MELDELRDLIDQHEAFPGLVQKLLAGHRDHELRSRYQADKWSPLEILVHLRDEEIEDFRARAMVAASGEEITNGIRPQEWVTERGYNQEMPAPILDSFAAERRVSIAWLRGLTQTQLERAAISAKFGFRAVDFIAAWRMHDLLHLRQLTNTLARLSAQHLAGYRIDYAGEL